jgi:hypothetical protein
MLAPDLRQQLDAIHSGHSQIRDQEVTGGDFQLRKALLGPAEALNRYPLPFQHPADDPTDSQIIIHQKDATQRITFHLPFSLSTDHTW